MIFEVIVTFTTIQLFFEYPKHHPKERYRWTNEVLFDEKPPKDVNGNRPVTPYYDPPPGGWKYSYTPSDNEIYYWETGIPGRYNYLNWYKNGVFEFQDSPTTVKGKDVLFETCLVDTFENDKKLECVKWKLTKKTGISIIK